MKVELCASIWTGKTFEERSVVVEVYEVNIMYAKETLICHSDVADFGLIVNEYNEVNFDFRYDRVSLEIVEIG
jgi:hypothetical protein